MIALLAGTATLGIVVQTGILFLFWRRTGLHVRPDFRWRGVGLGQIGRLAGWTFLMVLAGQLAGLVQSRVLSRIPEGDAGSWSRRTPGCCSCSRTRSSCSRSGRRTSRSSASTRAAGRDDEVRADIGRSIRTLGLFVVVATAALAVASMPASRIFTDNARRGRRRRAGAAVLPRQPRARSPCCSSCSAPSTPTTTPARRSSSRCCSASSSSPRRSSPRRRSPLDRSRRASRSGSRSRASSR